VVIVNCTQCLRGAVHPEAYETGSTLSRAGVISGLDMTVEAALAKLFFLLGSETSAEAVRRRMGEDLCGELSRVAPREIKTIIEKRYGEDRNGEARKRQPKFQL